tara:strand:+ start:220 stop:423 length:204 start_codon:yes stop_codon:yes gene_type:complete
MCTSAPKIPDPVPPPAPAPPPVKTARKIENKALKSRSSVKKKGTSSLTVQRPTVNTASSGSGVNVSY